VAAAALIAGGRLALAIDGKLGHGTGLASAMRWLRWPILGLTFMMATGAS